jgi:hypothetical protein
MRLKPDLLAPLVLAAVLLGAAASADAARSSFGTAVGKFCSAENDLAPIDAKLTAAGTSTDLSELSKLEGVVAQAATKTGVAKLSSPLHQTYTEMKAELLLMGEVYGKAATVLMSEQHLTKAQATSLAKAYTTPVLSLVKQFKAIGASACNH